MAEEKKRMIQVEEQRLQQIYDMIHQIHQIVTLFGPPGIAAAPSGLQPPRWAPPPPARGMPPWAAAGETKTEGMGKTEQRTWQQPGPVPPQAPWPGMHPWTQNQAPWTPRNPYGQWPFPHFRSRF
jgi:hypothetical protein